MRTVPRPLLLLGIGAAFSLFSACSGVGDRPLPSAGPASQTVVFGGGTHPFGAGPLASPGIGAPRARGSAANGVIGHNPWLAHLTSKIPLNVAVLYVSGATCACVMVYSQRGTSQAPIGIITRLSDPRGLFVDEEGDLYIGNSFADSVPIYEEGVLGRPAITLSDPGFHPSDVTRDGDHGTIYVVNQNTDFNGPGNVAVYANGSTTPTSYLDTHPNEFIDSIALDAHHNLFVGYGDTQGVAQIDEFKNGSTTPIQLPTKLGYTGGMEMDEEGRLVVADPDFFNQRSGPAVDVLDVGRIHPTHQFSQRGWPYYVAINKKDRRIYVSDANLGQVREYTYPGGVLIDTITRGMENGNYPVGVAVAHPSPL